MNGQPQDLKDQLLQTDEEFHDLFAKHHELEDRLQRTHLQALPFTARTTRRSHTEKAQAAAQGPHGRHSPAASTGLKPLHHYAIWRGSDVSQVVAAGTSEPRRKRRRPCAVAGTPLEYFPCASIPRRCLSSAARSVAL